MGVAGWKERLREEMLGYERRVRQEQERVQPFIEDSLKYLERTLKKLMPEEISSKIKFQTIGSLALGTPYALSGADNILDIFLWSTEHQTLQEVVDL